MATKQNRLWADHYSQDYNDYDLPKWNEPFGDSKELNGSYAYPDGNIPLYTPHGNPLGNGIDHVGPTHSMNYANWFDPEQVYALNTYNALKQTVNDLSSEEMQTSNPNIKGNLLYGYGNPALSWDGREYPYNPEYDEHMVPENQDTLEWHLWANDVDPSIMSEIENATPEQRDDITRMFTLLRNASDYSRQRELDQVAEEYKQRDLYGDTLVDLLQNTPQGQSLLNTIPAARFKNRERNVTGSGTGAFIR